MLRGRQLSAGFTWKPYVILGDHQNLKILWRSPDTSCSITTTCGTATQVTDGLLDTGDHFMYEVNFLSGIPICTGETFLNYTVACSMGGNNYEESGSVLLPPASSTERTKFIAYGDTRSYPADHNNVAGSILTNSDAYRGLILHVGDYVNDGSCISQWDTQFFDPLRTNISDMLMGSPMNGCRGNHENYGGCYSDMGAADDYHTLYDNIFPFDWATHYYEPAACTSPLRPALPCHPCWSSRLVTYRTLSIMVPFMSQLLISTGPSGRGNMEQHIAMAQCMTATMPRAAQSTSSGSTVTLRELLSLSS